MTIHYPDVASFQAGILFTGCPAACVKATEGTGYVNPDYAAAKTRARQAGAFLIAYHFLHPGNPGGQAAHAHAVAGQVPLMLDVEAEGASNPGVADVAGFVAAYRALGGICHLLYLPRWYWRGVLGSPPLDPLAAAGLALVSSNYTTYSDTGPGWAPYGGMTPAVWQYTSTATLNGYRDVDMNAFKGSLDEFRALVTTGTRQPPAPPQPAPPPPQPAAEEDTVTILNLPPAGAAAVLPVPAGAKTLTLYADPGFKTLTAPTLRVIFHGAGQSIRTVTPAWDTPAVLPAPAGSRVSIARLDAGDVPVTAAWT